MTGIIITSSILIIIILIIRKLFIGKISRRLQYALWLVAALRLLLPGMSLENVYNFASFAMENEQLESIADHQQTPYGTVEDIVPAEGENAPQYTKGGNDFAYKSALRYIWLGGMTVLFAVFFLSNVCFFQKIRADRKLIERQGGLSVYESGVIDTPCLYGLFPPSIYMMRESNLSEEERECVLMHEKMHYCHLDYIWAVVRVVCVCIYWFNPLVWFAAYVSRKDGELACDEAVLRQIGEGRRVKYGQTILNIASIGRYTDFLRCSTGMSSSKRELEERIRLLSAKKNIVRILPIAVIVIVALVGISAFGAKGLTKEKGADNTSGGEEIEKHLLDGEMKIWEITEKDFKDDYRSQWIIFICNKIPDIDLNLDGSREEIYITKRSTFLSGKAEIRLDYHMNGQGKGWTYSRIYEEESGFELTKMAAFAIDGDTICLAAVYNTDEEGNQESTVFLFKNSWSGSVAVSGDITEQKKDDYYPQLKKKIPADNEAAFDEESSGENR